MKENKPVTVADLLAVVKLGEFVRKQIDLTCPADMRDSLDKISRNADLAHSFWRCLVDFGAAQVTIMHAEACIGRKK